MSNDNFIKTRMQKFAQMSEQDRDALMSSFNGNHFVHNNELVISQKLLEEVILTLEHARKFIESKWISMHPHGIELYDECLKDLKIAIAKAKGESCSTLCHPEEECFITESGKCEAKEE